MSDDKQLSGMVVCDRNHKPHQRSPFAAGGACINPRPASPTPEQPAQACPICARERWTTGSSKGKCMRDPLDCYRLGYERLAALAPPAQTQQGLSEDESANDCEACSGMGNEEGIPFSSSGPCKTCGGSGKAAPLNPDKQPSPSAAPAQEPETLTKAELAALLDRAAPGADYLAVKLRGGTNAEADRAEREAGPAQPASPEGALHLDFAPLHEHGRAVDQAEAALRVYGGPAGVEVADYLKRTMNGLRAGAALNPCAAPEGALREALELRVFVKIKATELLTNERCVCGHTDNQHSGELCFGTEGDRGEDGDGSCPCSKSGSFRMDIADTLLECMGMLTDDESAVLFMREVLRLAALAGQPAREQQEKLTKEGGE